MRRIQTLVDCIEEELEGAKNYTEMYLDLKADGSQWASKFRDMANDELGHAMNIHNYAKEEIDKLRKVYTPTAEMQEMWDHEHKVTMEKVAWIKTMLSM